MEKSPIHVIARWKVKPGKLETVLGLLPKIVKASLAEEGVLFYKIQQDGSDQNTLFLFEGYKDDTAARHSYY